MGFHDKLLKYDGEKGRSKWCEIEWRKIIFIMDDNKWTNIFLYILTNIYWNVVLLHYFMHTVDRKTIRALEIVRVKKLIPNAVLWNKCLSIYNH